MKCIGAVLLAAAIVLPASAQIIIGGKTVPDPSVTTQATIGSSGGAHIGAGDPAAEPLVVAIPAFATSNDADRDLAAQIVERMSADLKSSGLFTLAEVSTSALQATSISTVPAYSAWTAIGAQALLVGKLSQDQRGIVVQFRLFDVAAGKQLVGTQYVLPTAASFRVAHKIADDVYVNLTGSKGYFDTRITYVSGSGRNAQLMIMDQDGANATPPLSGSSPNLMAPRFSPGAQQIAYLGEAPIPGKTDAGQLTAILYSLATGQREPLIKSSQPSSGLRYSPDGKSVVYLKTGRRAPDLYALNLSTRTEKKLASDIDADDAPSFSPDGARLVDSSVKHGLIVMSADGSPIACPTGSPATFCELTSNGEVFGHATWSPEGQWIAFDRADRSGKGSSIGVVRNDGTGLRMLTNGQDDHSPAWAPNGDVIAFERRSASGPRLWSVNLSGRNAHELATSGPAAQPDWSAKLP